MSLKVILDGLNLDAGNEKTREPIDEIWEPETEGYGTKEKNERCSASVYSCEQLLGMRFEELKWVVSELIPGGLTLLCGKPKIGKSFFALNVAVSIAAGGRAFGKYKVEQGKVLYVGLEDPLRRVQERMMKFHTDNTIVGKNLFFADEWPRIDEGGDEELLGWIKNYENTRLVIIDTLVKIKSRNSLGNKNSYDTDYQTIEDTQNYR